MGGSILLTARSHSKVLVLATRTRSISVHARWTIQFTVTPARRCRFLFIRHQRLGPVPVVELQLLSTGRAPHLWHSPAVKLVEHRDLPDHPLQAKKTPSPHFSLQGDHGCDRGVLLILA